VTNIAQCRVTVWDCFGFDVMALHVLLFRW